MNNLDNNIYLCEIDNLDCECKNNFQKSKNENFDYVESEEVLVGELKISSSNPNIYNVKKNSLNFMNFSFVLILTIIFLIIKKVIKYFFSFLIDYQLFL